MNSNPETNGPPAASSSASGAQVELEACWNKIGVYGSGACEELQKFIHCRNCPVYSQAGVQLLDRPMSPEYRREWSEHFALEKKAAAPARISVVVFRVGAEWLALPTNAFQEVAERKLTHSLPHRRQAIVIGLVNIRGELLICVSLSRLLGLETRVLKESRRHLHDRLMVVHWDGNRLAFPVDEVHGVHRFQPQELKEAPVTVAKATATYTRGIVLWQSKAVGFLDADSLFSSLNRSLS
jgi:chemotaxis-related protein WspD